MGKSLLADADPAEVDTIGRGKIRYRRVGVEAALVTEADMPSGWEVTVSASSDIQPNPPTPAETFPAADLTA